MTFARFSFEISGKNVDPCSAMTKIGDFTHGAQSCFFGVVRSFNAGKNVVAVEYDAALPLAENVIQSICRKAAERFGGDLRIFVQHRVGRLEVGQISVAVVVSSPHREEAIMGCRYIIEQIKARAPIWKREFYEDGQTEWLKGHSLCRHATQEMDENACD